MTQPLDRPAGKRRRRWVGIALLISLALNLMVAGYFIAHKLRPEKYRRITGPGYTQIIPRNFFFDVSRDRRRELVEAMRSHRRAFRDLRQDVRTAAIRLADALEAEPFDPNAVAAELELYRSEAVEMIDAGNEIGQRFFNMLTADERKLLANRIRQKAEGRRGRKKK